LPAVKVNEDKRIIGK